MNHIITYNEAIRWYKNGKIEPFKDVEEPIVEKDLFIFQYNVGYYIAYYQVDYFQSSNAKWLYPMGFTNPKTTKEIFIKELFLFDSDSAINNIRIIIPDRIPDNTLIKYINGNLTIESTIDNLPIEIKERIINI